MKSTVAALSAAAVVAAAGVSAGPVEKRAYIAQNFAPPSTSPLVQTSNYTGFNNASYPKHDIVPGKAFDRVFQVWLENTDYEAAISTPAMQALLSQGVLLDNYYAVTHPSEPNYIASVAGDFFGLSDDAFYHVPTNISTVFDLLDDGGKAGKPISYACYAENMPYDGFTASTTPQRTTSTPPLHRILTLRASMTLVRSWTTSLATRLVLFTTETLMILPLISETTRFLNGVGIFSHVFSSSELSLTSYIPLSLTLTRQPL